MTLPGDLERALREELTTGDPKTRKLLIDLLRQAIREELTSGDAGTRKLLADLLLSIILKDSAGAELSGYVKNLDIPLSMLPLGELCLIPAWYHLGGTAVYGYSAYSGGNFTLFTSSLTGGHWSSSTAGDYIEFQFYGTWFDVVFYQKSGVANIYVDGTKVATVDVSALKGPVYNLVWHGPRNLSDGYHTVRIEVASGAVYVVGILADPAKNAWRIVPFPLTLLYYANVGYGIYTRSYSTGYPIFAEKWPAYKTYVSTTTTLAAGGSWTSAWIDCLGSMPRAKKIYITCYSDQSGTIYIDYSPDGTNVDGSESISYTGGTTPAIAAVEVKGRYARIRYVNGTTDQTVFRLYAFFMGE
jgi:hypothetical protein